MPIDNYARAVALLDDQIEMAEKAVQMVMNRSLRELCADLDAAGAEMSEVEIAGLMQLGAIWDSVEAGEAAMAGIDRLRAQSNEGLPGEADSPKS
ncbi:MAG TPA: hypothetical protein PLG23_02870 [Thermoflexales bacterium]|jgi:hypothetical protein|nr:hypothetical protein [Anaerolineae bacterium]HQV28546.1 hypothetical protein [Thermoflexales bacterium]HQX09446.1 hypothetical protein [Thermoflexales bacterium]HQY26450.1 hypothetical protein [Thermoflexales bacterium]HQZ52374.1 hypothetical protein [Thermoflexales bacterium]